MRILLISANTEPFPEPVFPIGVVYVAHALQNAGARVRIFDLRHGASRKSLMKEIESFKPDRIGISLRNIDNAAYPSTRFYLPEYKSLIENIRALSHVPIILGGSAFSLFPEEVFFQLEPDAGIRGEGEAACEAFLNPGQETIRSSAPVDLGEVRFPGNIREIFPGFNRYRTMSIQTARGCPNRCIYCTYPNLEGRTVRVRPPETVSSEIAMLYGKFGIRDFFIVNSLFNSDEDHMIKVLECVAGLKLAVRLSCYLQPKISDPDIFRLMKEAGCIAIDFGTDSGSTAMLSSLRKPFTKDDIRMASKACMDTGIDFCHSLILGGPGETPETIRETVDLMDQVRPRAIVAMTGVRIYPGTEIRHIAVDQGMISMQESLLEPSFYFSRMGPSSLLKCAYEAGNRRSNWFFPGKRDWGKSIGFKILHFLYRRGPLWRAFSK